MPLKGDLIATKYRMDSRCINKKETEPSRTKDIDKQGNQTTRSYINSWPTKDKWELLAPLEEDQMFKERSGTTIWLTLFWQSSEVNKQPFHMQREFNLAFLSDVTHITT